MRELANVDVLIPTFNRTNALAVTLASLIYQTYKRFDIIVSDQSDAPVGGVEEILAVKRVLELKGHRVTFLRNLPCQGMAQQREFLLEHARAPFVLYLDDDLLLEPYVLELYVQGIEEEKCGFVGGGTIGLNYLEDNRQHEQKIEFWEEKVNPEIVTPGSREWRRHVVHNAANIFHVQRQYQKPKKYKLAWASACVLYDREKLVSSGGFNFWKSIPRDHCGEDVAAQLRVMAKFGGCGMIPCGVYHQELKTTLPSRKFNIPEQIRLFDDQNSD